MAYSLFLHFAYHYHNKSSDHIYHVFFLTTYTMGFASGRSRQFCFKKKPQFYWSLIKRKAVLMTFCSITIKLWYIFHVQSEWYFLTYKHKCIKNPDMCTITIRQFQMLYVLSNLLWLHMKVWEHYRTDAGLYKCNVKPGDHSWSLRGGPRWNCIWLIIRWG